ncbi:MAG: ArsR family transcriptional regulator [bacterium]
MRSMQTDLTPSLWRTCRVLANARRLCLLRSVVVDGAGCVSELAQRTSLPEEKASQHLRLLQSRGLLRAMRTGPHVSYHARADPLVKHAEPLLAALCDAVRVESAEDLLSEVTAFTHPRRQVLVRCLAEKPLDAVALAARSKISMPAVFRHLRKLRRRGLVGCTSEDTYVLLRPESRFAQRLLQIAVE